MVGGGGGGGGGGARRRGPARERCARLGVVPGGRGAAALVAPPRAAAAAAGEAPPRLHSLAGPNPNARRDAHHKAHEVLEHEHPVLGLGARLAGVRAGARAGERSLPALVIVLFVQVAGHHDAGWHSVEQREDADADHELLQLVRLGAALLDDAANAEERHEARQEEERAHQQVEHHRAQHEAAQRVQVLVPHVADAGHRVPVHGAQCQRSDGLDTGDEPRGQVEVLRIAHNGLVAPLHASRQEPGE